jgi:hypothetical protein
MPERPQTEEMKEWKLAAGAFPAWPLPPGPAAAGFARFIVRSVLAELAVPPAVAGDAQTIISELATNAVVHGDRERAEVWAYLSRHPAPHLTLKVFDAAPWRGSGAVGPADVAALITGEPASDACGDRGLMLVNALTEEAGGCWGVHRTRRRLGPGPVSGKAVYFTVPLREASAVVLPPPMSGPVAERLCELGGVRGLRARVSHSAGVTVVHFGAGLWVSVNDGSLLYELPEHGVVRRPSSDVIEVVEQMVRLSEEDVAGGSAPRASSRNRC